MKYADPKTVITPAGARVLDITPPEIVGPFYPVSERPDLAADLARPSGSIAEAQGQLLYI
ncbi:hypothetical protein ACFQX9_16470 [Bradyrhizobium sp. GCM10028915]|uniref:hypothetical protein n=1 Tax=Bradyrhizobium sp. GCM10028915 TaxID=3273385 RepID=UPI00361A4F70